MFLRVNKAKNISLGKMGKEIFLTCLNKDFSIVLFGYKFKLLTLGNSQTIGVFYSYTQSAYVLLSITRLLLSQFFPILKLFVIV